MRALLPLLLLPLLLSEARAQDSTWLSPDLVVVKLSRHVYQHTSWFENEQFGRFSCNGMLVSSHRQAMLFDTPMSDSSTVTLLDFIQNTLGDSLIGFVPNHYHEDCTEGMDFLPKRTQVYANKLTLDSLPLRLLRLPVVAFGENMPLVVGGVPVELAYHGRGHTLDNIVAWVPQERILFAGCMCKSIRSKTLGWTGDADMAEWPKTIEKVYRAYPTARKVIPGHGAVGGRELLRHTLKLLQK